MHLVSVLLDYLAVAFSRYSFIALKSVRRSHFVVLDDMQYPHPLPLLRSIKRSKQGLMLTFGKGVERCRE